MSGLKTTRRVLNRLFRPYRGRIVLLNLLVIAQSVLQVGFAVVTRYVVDAALNKDSGLLRWGILLAAVLLLLVLVHAVYAWFTGSTVDKCSAHFRRELLWAAACCGEEQRHRYHSGELLSRGMDDVRAVCDGVVTALPALIGQGTKLACAFIAILMLYKPIAPVLLIGGAVVLLVTACLRPVLKKHHVRVRKAEERVVSCMQEDLQQLELIQGLQVEEETLHRFYRYQKQSLREKYRRRRWSVGANSVIALASHAATGALLLWGAVQVAADALSYGALTAMLQLLNLFRGPVLGLSGLWTRLTGVEVAAERLTELMAYEPPCGEPEQVDKVRAVVFQNVTFSYPDDPTPVLEDFSASFPLEQWACLTGMSGKGKSTLFKLMLGLYKPQKGRVYLQTDNGDVDCSAGTRHLFAYVPQDYALFSGTVMDNLLLVAPDADTETRHHALRAAQAGFVLDMNQGEKTHIRENNTGLSMGQLQRIAIARAILMQRPILLLDECTSALDAATEQQVLENLEKLGKQAILVTHRPEALQGKKHITFVNMEK